MIIFRGLVLYYRQVTYVFYGITRYMRSSRPNLPNSSARRKPYYKLPRSGGRVWNIRYNWLFGQQFCSTPFEINNVLLIKNYPNFIKIFNFIHILKMKNTIKYIHTQRDKNLHNIIVASVFIFQAHLIWWTGMAYILNNLLLFSPYTSTKSSLQSVPTPVHATVL